MRVRRGLVWRDGAEVRPVSGHGYSTLGHGLSVCTDSCDSVQIVYASRDTSRGVSRSYCKAVDRSLYQLQYCITNHVCCGARTVYFI